MRTLWQASARVSAVSDPISGLTGGQVPFGYMSYEGIDESPGLYCFWLRGRCLYIGMSMNLRRRLGEHCTAEDNLLLRHYFETYRNEIMLSFSYHDVSERRLRAMESDAISEMRPLTNNAGGTP